MGCDIHLYKEKREDDNWITADSDWGLAEAMLGNEVFNNDVMDISWKTNFVNRDYNLFGLLVDGVRRSFSYSFSKRGLPKDVCELVGKQANEWGIDGHNHSHLLLAELRTAAVNLLLQNNSDIVKWQLQGLSNIIGFFPDNVNGNTYRIVFWFDN
jgi:hypothetical protein